jgi:transcriptional regulator with XRE-family HTH domain
VRTLHPVQTTRCRELYVPQWRGDATSKNRVALVASLRRSNSGQPSPDAYARARNSRKIAQPTFVAIGRSPIRLTHVTLQIGYRATVPALASVERSKRNVSIDNIARIARGLQIEPWRLLKRLLNSLRRADLNSGKLGLADCVLEVENLALKLRIDAVGPKSCPLGVRTPDWKQNDPWPHQRIQKKPAIVAAMHWPKSACAVGRAGDEMGARMARSRLRLAVRALLKMRKARRRHRRRTLPAHR